MTKRFKRYITYSLIGILLLIAMSSIVIHFWPGPQPQVQSFSVLTSVTFGNSGTCVGEGLCNCVVGQQPKSNAIPVTFITFQDNQNLVLVTFRFSALMRSQPLQRRYFNQQTTSYPFSSAFPLTDVMFAPLHLLPGSVILPTTPSRVVFATTDSIVDSITLIPNSVYVNANVTFGSAPQITGLCDPTVGGICSVSQVPNSSGLPITFIANSTQQNTFNMYFSISALDSTQGSQSQLISSTTTNQTYTFAAPFPLDPQIFSKLNLQGQSPNIPAGVPFPYTVNGDMVTMTVTYSPNLLPR